MSEGRSVTSGSSLDRALVSGIAWNAVLRWSAQLVSWVATFVAARLLAAGDYGIVSMATLGIGFARMVEDFGLDSVLVQDRGIVGERQARLAGLIVALGIGLSVLFVVLAEPIALFFREPHVAWAVAGLSPLFVMDALQVVPRAALQRRLQFRRFAALSLVQMIATQAVLLVGAARGWGFWALVSSSLSGGLAVTVLLFAWHPYVIALPRDLAALRQPLLMGWRVIAGRFAYYLLNSADQTVIGRVLGKEALGTYSFALTFANLPLQEIGAIVSRVVPGVFSEIQQQRIALRRYFLILTEFLACLTLPIAIGLALTADLAIPLIMGPKWSGVIGPLRILCLYAAFQGCQSQIGSVLMWTGQFRAVMWCTVLAAVAMSIAFLAVVSRGISAISWVWAIVYPLVNVPPLILGLKTVHVSVRSWLGALAPPLVSCAAMTATVLIVRAALSGEAPVTTLGASIAAGAGAYCMVLWFAFRARLAVMMDMVRTVRGGAFA